MHTPVFCLILVGFATTLAQYGPYSPYPVANARGPSSSPSYSRGPSGAPYGAGQASRSNGYGGQGSRAGGDAYGGDSYDTPRASEEDPDADGVVGVAGRDYPTYDQVPQTAFSCQDHQFPGIYADTDPQCQVFHICQFDGRHDSFLCPNGSIFNQQYFVCDWWYNVDCSQAPSFYSLNAQLYQDVSSSRSGGYPSSGDQYGPQRTNGGAADIYGAAQRSQVYNGGAQRAAAASGGASGAHYGGSQGGQGRVGAGTPVYSSGRHSSPSSRGQQQQPGYPRADTQPIY